MATPAKIRKRDESYLNLASHIYMTKKCGSNKVFYMFITAD